MSFAVPFRKDFKYLQDKSIQLNINYKPKIKQLNNFIQQYQDHRINLRGVFEQDSDIAIFKVLQEKYPETQLVAAVPYYSKNLESILSQAGIPHYYQTSIFTWDAFQFFLILNVTDIVIEGEIAFSAKIASNAAKKNNISLRCICNKVQSQAPIKDIKKFFIRPEDIDLYSLYFSTFEFCLDYPNKDCLNTIYEIYAIKQKWTGRLDEIIIGYKGEENSQFLYPVFGQRRLNCKWRCLSNDSCHSCDYIANLMDSLKNAQLVIS